MKPNLLTALIGSAFLCLSGCRPDPYAGKTSLRYMAWGNPEQLAVEQKLCDEFNAANPDLHVSLLRVPGSAYMQKMMIMLASDTAPDVMRVDHYYFASLQKKHYFADLSPFAAADRSFHPDEFWPSALAEGTVNGQLYGLNVLFGGLILYYNKSLFQAAGLEDPYQLYQRGGWTYDAFRQDAKALSRRGPDGTPESFGFSMQLAPHMVAPFVWGFGGDLLTPDHKRCLFGEPKSVAGIQFLADLRFVDHAMPTTAENANAAFPFEGGRLGMTIDFMGMAPTYRKVATKFDWDVVPIPRGPVSGSTLIKGNQAVITEHSSHKAAAWRFLRFMTGPIAEKLLYVDLRRCFPTRIAIAESPEYLHSSQPPFQDQAFVDAIKSGRPLPIDDRWFEWTSVAQMDMDNLFSGRDKDAARVMRQTARDIDKVLTEEPGW